MADGIPADSPTPTQAAAAPAMCSLVTDPAEAIRLLREGARALEAIDHPWGVLNLELVVVILLSAIGDTKTAQEEIATLLPAPASSRTPRTW